MAAEHRGVRRGQLGVECPRLSGEAWEHPLPAPTGEVDVRPHAERLRSGHEQACARAAGAAPAGRRHGGGTRGAAQVDPERRPDSTALGLS
ncbi:hypothetical protein SGPA1_30720 [Streptomyces misionensis JCM 4497]